MAFLDSIGGVAPGVRPRTLPAGMAPAVSPTLGGTTRVAPPVLPAPASPVARAAVAKPRMQGLGGIPGLTQELVNNFVQAGWGSQEDALAHARTKNGDFSGIRWAGIPQQLAYHVKGGHFTQDPATGLYFDRKGDGSYKWYDSNMNQVSEPSGGRARADARLAGKNAKTSAKPAARVAAKPLQGVGGNVPAPVVPTASGALNGGIVAPGSMQVGTNPVAPPQPYGISSPTSPNGLPLNPMDDQRKRLAMYGGMPSIGGNLFGLT